MWGIIMAGGTFLTLVVLTVYAQPRQELVKVDLEPLLTPAAPLSAGASQTGPDLVVFSQRNVFQEIVTPIPTATKVPKAVPTATPRPLGLHWKLQMVMDGTCGIVNFQKEFIMLSLGDEFEGARIKEVNVDSASIVIEDILDGRTRTLLLNSGE